jgi:hypothetical protein
MRVKQARGRTERDGGDGGRRQDEQDKNDDEGILSSKEISAVSHHVHSHDRKALWSSEENPPASVWLTDVRWRHVLQPSQLSLLEESRPWKRHAIAEVQLHRGHSITVLQQFRDQCSAVKREATGTVTLHQHPGARRGQRDNETARRSGGAGHPFLGTQ